MSHYDISSQVPDYWLVQTKIDIIHGKISLTEAAKHVLIQTVDGVTEEIQVHRNTLRTIFEKHGIKIYKECRTDFRTQYSEQLISIVKAKADRLQCGITKLWEAMYWDNLSNPNYPSPTRYTIQRICQENLHYPTKPKKSAKKIRVRYLVTQVHGAWHGDIHYVTIPALDEQKYLFALIDDRSRMIVGFNLLNTKTADGVIQTLDETIKRLNVSPFIYWSDNGGENIADSVCHFLESHGIIPIRTIPGNPESNGKIERFWPNVQKRLDKIQTWDEALYVIINYIGIYNYETPHSGLETINGKHPTPAMVFNNQIFQKTNLNDCKIRIDDSEISLAKFVGKEN